MVTVRRKVHGMVDHGGVPKTGAVLVPEPGRFI